MPVLTVAEYKQAPTAVDTGNLAVGSDTTTQDVELANIILRAQAWMESFISQAIVAGTATETRRVRCNRFGEFILKPDNTLGAPKLTALAYGTSIAGLVNLSAAALANTYTARQILVVPSTSATGIQFGALPADTKIIARYTYTYGYVATTLTSSPSAAATSFTVSDPTSITAGKHTIYDGKLTETVTVASVAGSTITISPGLVNAHTSGAGFSNLLPDLKQAAIYVVTSLIKGRAADTLTMSTTLNPGPQGGPDPVASQDLRGAREILRNYFRLR